MTVPKIATVSRGGSRFYVEPTTGEKVPGVTSILNMLPKPFLQAWSAKMVAEFAVDNFGAYSALVMNGQRQAAIDLLKAAPRRYTKERADIGTEVHDLYEKLSRGEDLGRYHPDFQPYVDSWNEWADAFQPEFLFNEETVWSDAHRYAGSFDFMAKIEGETVVGDFKTTKSTYPEVALQLSAYAHADRIVRPDGNSVPLPEVTAGAVFHVNEDKWEFIPVRVDDKVFDVFLALRHDVYEWVQEFSKDVLGKPLAPPRKRTTGSAA
jgi:hypothetical protein